MQIRRVNLQDVTDNDAFIKKGLKEILQEINYEFINKKVNNIFENLKKFILDNSAVLYGAFEDQTLIGFVWAYKIENNKYHINYFYVGKEKRNMGVATRLLNTLKEDCKINKIYKIELNVGKQNENAIKFYEKNKFNPETIKMSMYIEEVKC